jgi:hypothetical protein
VTNVETRVAGCGSLAKEGFFLSRWGSLGTETEFRRYLKAPLRVPYSLGRPLAPVLALTHPDQVEEQVARLVKICQERMEAGGVVGATGDCLSETSFYTILSLAATRLRKRGRSVAVCGSPFISGDVPQRPAADVAILLDAQAYEDLRKWMAAKPSQVVILGGQAGQADITISPPNRERAETEAAPFSEKLVRIQAANQDKVIGDGVLLCAAGIDLPREFFEDRVLPPPFEPVKSFRDEITAWVSIPGVWLARKTLSAELAQADWKRLRGRLSRWPGLVRRLDHFLH